VKPQRGLLTSGNIAVRNPVFTTGASFEYRLKPLLQYCFSTSMSVAGTDIIQCKGKGKALPLQTWTGPEGSRRLRLPDFKRVGT